jgi:hypothetical protein
MYLNKSLLEGPQWGFGSDKRSKTTTSQESPGPGTYLVPDIKDPKAFTMSSRVTTADKRFSPGPGAYSPSKSKEAPLFTIGKGPRASLRNKSQEAPGPGSYQSRTWTEQFANPVKFGTSTRRPISSTSCAPGPGTYTASPKQLDGPAFSMRSRTAKPKRFDVPVSSRQGPGTYQQKISEFVYETSPKSRFGTSKRGVDSAGNPVGPGMYDVRGKLIGPRWGFGTSGRSSLQKKTEFPGPGTYSIKPTVPSVPYYEKV